MKLTIFYDNWCPNCSKFANLIQKLDWLKSIEIKQIRNEADTSSLYSIDLELAKQQMATFTNKWHYGFNSLFFISVRVPLFWLFIPVLYLLKITNIGHFLYVQLAIRRKIIPLHCDKKTCGMP
jgi:predicted DCC family thiol-disulfide oxidoreductase YuxK